MELLLQGMPILKPPPLLTVSEWADANRQLSPESSAEPGRWQTSRAEFQRGVMDAASDPLIQTIVLMSSAQVGKTEILNNIVGFHIAQDPSSMLIINPTIEMSETWSKDRLAPMLRDTPALKGKVREPRSKNSGNTLKHKVFPGGQLSTAGANSAASLASRPVRILACDEVDRYPPSAGSEGDPVQLGKKRTQTYWNKLIILTSTPTVKGVSRIELEFELSDKRYFMVPCPHCDHAQRLMWSHVVWDEGQPETAHYACEECGAAWTEQQRHLAVRKGKWVATKPGGNRAGFHLSEIYSPWSTLEAMARGFLEAKKDPELLKTWVNTSIGESWEDREGEKVDHGSLYNRREDYGAEVPMDALLLTAGLDVQRDRVEMEVVAWGEGERSWNVDYKILTGDPTKDEFWQNVDDALGVTYQHESGSAMQITSAVIDSGDQTTTVYDFVKKTSHQRLFAGKGVAGAGRPVAQISRKASGKKKRNVDLYTIGVDDAKGIIFGRFRIEEPGPGYCHFPLARDAEYFEQLTAEKLVTKYRKGFAFKEWQATRPRNEALDCRVYAYAALKILNPVWSAIQKRVNKKVEPEVEPKPRRTTQRARPVRRRKNWATDI